MKREKQTVKKNFSAKNSAYEVAKYLLSLDPKREYFTLN